MRNEIESKTLELNMKTQEQAVSQSLNTEPIIAAHHRGSYVFTSGRFG